MTLAQKIKHLRDMKHLTPKALAEVSGLDLSSIYRIENGEISQLKSDALKKLAEALDVTTDYLVGRTQGMGIEDHLRIYPGAEEIFSKFALLNRENKDMIKKLVAFLIEDQGRRDRNMKEPKKNQRPSIEDHEVDPGSMLDHP